MLDKDLKKLLKEKLLKDLNEMLNDQSRFNCEIKIKMRNGKQSIEAKGNGIGMLVALSSATKELQEKFDISDEKLEEIMSNVVKREDD